MPRNASLARKGLVSCAADVCTGQQQLGQQLLHIRNWLLANLPSTEAGTLCVRRPHTFRSHLVLDSAHGLQLANEPPTWNLQHTRDCDCVQAPSEWPRRSPTNQKGAVASATNAAAAATLELEGPEGGGRISSSAAAAAASGSAARCCSNSSMMSPGNT